MTETDLITRYTAADVERWFGAKEITKAKPYVARIERLEIGNGRITGWVQGSASSAYRVRVEFLPVPPNGRRATLEIVPSCSCPVAVGCKHAAALLLAAIDQRTTSTETVRPEIQAWLMQLQGLVNPHPILAPKPKRASSVLHYVLIPPMHGVGWQVEFIKSAAHTDGEISRTATIWTHFESALLKQPAFAQEEDIEIIRLAWTQRSKDHARYMSRGLPLTGKHTGELLDRILATGRAWLPGDRRSYNQLHQGAERPASLQWFTQPNGVVARLVSQPASGAYIPASPPWYVDTETGEIGHLTTGIAPHVLAHLMTLPVLGETEAQIVSDNLAKLAPDLPRPTALREVETLSAPLQGVLRIRHTFDHAEQNEDATIAMPLFAYGEHLFSPGQHGEYARRADGTPVRIQRDEEGERRLVSALTRVGFTAQIRSRYDVPEDFPGPQVFALPYDDDWMSFEPELAPTLRLTGWQIDFPEHYYYRIHRPDNWFAEIESSGNDYALAMGIVVGGQRLSLAPLIHLMLRTDTRWFNAAERDAIPDHEGVRFKTDTGLTVELPAGRLKPLVSTLADLLDRPSGGAIRLGALDAARIAEATSIGHWSTRGMDTAFAIYEKLKAAEGVALAEPPRDFGAQLRPYQLHGLAWLQYLREHQLGGILADDMGLGKTAQTLAHLLVEQQAGRLGFGPGRKPALVVLPTSLIFNWKREAAQFAPQLKMLSLHGQDRKTRFDEIAEHDVILTTYPLLWRDTEHLIAHEYHSLILDEAQVVKNAASRASATVRKIKSDHRLCLTGTPLENHLGELWSQFDFLLPGFLGESKHFAREWRTPIEKRGDNLRREVLARRIKPFILRRKKEDVAKELPPKSIIIRTVELEGTQRDLYETVRATMDKKVRDEIARMGFARSQIVILDALLKLRQICCDPRLLKSDAARKVKEKAKIGLLMDMLPELVDEGRRILVFSQFAEMLDLIENELIASHLKYVRLSGQTKDRETPIRQFQAGEVPIFLISLKAGGVGLNLTAADTVIHYDPWWNPAAENQATDRAHRIGQTKQVFVYKLIVAGSIEEKILGLQEKKAALAEGILADKADALAKFSADDIAALLAPLPR